MPRYFDIYTEMPSTFLPYKSVLCKLDPKGYTDSNVLTLVEAWYMTDEQLENKWNALRLLPGHEFVIKISRYNDFDRCYIEMCTRKRGLRNWIMFNQHDIIINTLKDIWLFQEVNNDYSIHAIIANL